MKQHKVNLFIPLILALFIFVYADKLPSSDPFKYFLLIFNVFSIMVYTTIIIKQRM